MITGWDWDKNVHTYSIVMKCDLSSKSIMATLWIFELSALLFYPQHFRLPKINNKFQNIAKRNNLYSVSLHHKLLRTCGKHFLIWDFACYRVEHFNLLWETFCRVSQINENVSQKVVGDQLMMTLAGSGSLIFTPLLLNPKMCRARNSTFITITII